jgi:hypothetical protein
MINTKSISSSALIVLLSVLVLSGCAGIRTFTQTARAGDTIAMAVGFKENWSRENINVYVTPNGSSTATLYPPNDPKIRAVMNFYPDPISSLVLSNRTGQSVTDGAQGYGNIINANFTSDDRDWSNTIVFFDLPQGLPLGETYVTVEDATNPNNYVDTIVDIVENVSGGQKGTFEAELAGNLLRKHLASLERASHFTVTLSGSGAIPHAVQIDFTHNPDAAHGGVGKPYVVEPISGLKNISWHDDGTNLRVIMIPANGATFANFKDFKFYVAGGITGLAVANTQAFDINGNAVSGVSTPTVTPHNIVITTAN